MARDPQFEILDQIAQSIFDKKGENILVLDVRGISSLTDFFVIAEGGAERHVQALAKTVIEKLDDVKMAPLHLEGEQVGDWVVVDFGAIVVHLFTNEMREKYDLENLWREAKIVDVKIDIGTLAKE
jgi:ribosome-associated protein